VNCATAGLAQPQAIGTMTQVNQGLRRSSVLIAVRDRATAFAHHG
jgi:hypothetical protein